jgi:hypothetical protein
MGKKDKDINSQSSDASLDTIETEAEKAPSPQEEGADPFTLTHNEEHGKKVHYNFVNSFECVANYSYNIYERRKMNRDGFPIQLCI